MSTPATPRRHILVVDDEPYICDAVRLMLGHDGHFVTTARSGPEALERFGKGAFDLVVTDYNMEGMKGDELAAAIKRTDPTQPVLMITADPNAPAGSIDGIIPKPFTMADLRKAVEDFARKENRPGGAAG